MPASLAREEPAGMGAGAPGAISSFVIRHSSFATLAVLLVFILIAPLRVAAQSSPYTPYQHKALYLFNFAKFTEWPKEAFASDDAPFVIGILGTDPFGKDIEIIRGKTIKGRKIQVMYFKDAQEITGCHMLFICSSETNRLSEVTGVAGKSSMLTIAEAEGFTAQSGMIQLMVEKKSSGAQTVAFEINLPAAERASLRLDTQLLKLARRVI